MKRASRGLAVSIGLALAVPLIVPAAAEARKVIGDGKKKPDEGDDEKKPDEKKPDEKKPDAKKSEAEQKKEAEEKAAAEAKAREEEEARKAAEREAKEAEIERKSREKEMAEEAAERAAKEAKEKAEEEVRKAEEEKRRKADERKEANRAARLKTAKKLRTLTRQAEGHVVVATLTPGGPESEQLLEIRFDVGQKLKVASARFGATQPLKGLDLVATVSGPAGEARYLVHELPASGAYAFHTTPMGAGEYAVHLQGKDLDLSFPLHVGVWPPPDFEDEEKKNAEIEAQGTGRRILK